MQTGTGGELLTVKEAANLLGVSTQTIRRYLQAGKLSGKRVGKPILIPMSEVQRALNKGKKLKGHWLISGEYSSGVPYSRVIIEFSMLAGAIASLEKEPDLLISSINITKI